MLVVLVRVLPATHRGDLRLAASLASPSRTDISQRGKIFLLLLCLVLLGDLILGGGQPLPQLRLVELLLGTDGLPDVGHVGGLKVTGHNTT